MSLTDVSTLLHTAALGMRAADQVLDAFVRPRRTVATRVLPALFAIAIGVAAGVLAKDEQLRRRIGAWLRAAPPAPPVATDRKPQDVRGQDHPPTPAAPS